MAEPAAGAAGLLAQLGGGLVPVVVGVVTYAAAARLLRIPEMDEVLGLVRR